MSVEPLPPSIDELLADRAKARSRYPLSSPHRWRTSRVPLPLFSRILRTPQPDTPSASFYRLYEFFVLDWNVQLRNELEYFCSMHPTWSVFDLPDPVDTDPVRYAALAVLTRLMCDAFNRRIGLGLPRDAPAIILDFEELQARPKVYEQPPEWAQRVPALQERVFIPDAQGNAPVEGDEDISEEFQGMNIIVRMPHIHFI
ncbi:hypothetical protein SCP_0902700 [Sparassis crispa]|uniref:Uncharacterized protein n=1 Tax=Sparassis crispa TaxID=139825 RepID=A0A401GVZ5_9APHY|nr:hypothetical protein SCP_0902700 [Sparassis crispa]GBE86391.1 hypothetical protein SCP_0902700 [Sparassis crispa]